MLRRDRPSSNALVPVIPLDTQRMSHQILNVPFVKKLNNSPLTKEFLVSDTSEDNDDSYENFNDALLSLKVRVKEPLQC